MKYRVIEDFGSAKKGDELLEDETGLVSFYIEEGNTTRAMSMDCDTADLYIEEGKLQYEEEDDVDDAENTETTIAETVSLIDDMLDLYTTDYKAVLTKAANGEVQPCVKVEAETVFYNLSKVLNKIKSTLINE